MAKVKICGITNPEDAQCAIAHGADYVGLIFARSKRMVIKGQAKRIIDGSPDFKSWVGVFMNGKKKEIEETVSGLPISILQFHGNETPAFCNYFIKRGFTVIKVIPVSGNQLGLNPTDYEKVSFFLFDTSRNGQSGGTGETFLWSVIEKAGMPSISDNVFLSGGLTPNNVGNAINAVHPFAVDASSCLESSPGNKDHAQVELFIKNAKL